MSRNGGIRWGSRWVNVSHVLAELDVGFEEIDDGLWEVLRSGVARSLTRDHPPDRGSSGSRRPPRRRESQRESVTHQLITNCYQSSELFTSWRGFNMVASADAKPSG